MLDLDAPGRFRSLDPKGMLASIAGLPQQCEDAWRKVRHLDLPGEHHHASKMVIVGMGGSAIGADLLRTLVEADCPIPIFVHRNYMLPAFVDKRTLVIVCSYSGNTEEALFGFEDALRRGAPVLSITTGGELEHRASQHGLPVWSYHYPTQPRAAVGYSLMYLLGVLQHLGLIQDKSVDVAEAISVMRQWQMEVGASVPVEQNAAKSLAQKVHGRLPVVYAAEHLSEVARRWKGQFNENSKSWAVFDTLPELDHNTVVGYGLPAALAKLVHLVMLTSPLLHPRVLLRFDITRALLGRDGYGHDTVEARGRSALAQVLSLVHFGDYVSYYLAMLNAVDPWSIGNIEFVKDRLRSSPAIEA